jgi:hypothetical protein
MGCSSKLKKGGGKRKLAVLVGAVALAGCSASSWERIEDPLVINSIAIGTREGCCTAAKEKPGDAAIALRVLDGLGPQIEACRAGLASCLPADPNAD